MTSHATSQSPRLRTSTSERLTRFQEGLHRIGITLLADLDFDKAMARVLKEASCLFENESHAISLRDQEGFIVHTADGLPNMLTGTAMVPEVEPHAMLALSRREVQFIEDAWTDPRTNNSHMRKWNIRSVIVIPLVAGTKELGVAFFNWHTKAVRFDSLVRDAAQKIYALLSLSLAHAQSLAALRAELSAHEAAERARRESEELARDRLTELEAIYKTAPVGLCFLDKDLRWLRINDKLAEANGFPPEAHIGRTPWELIPDFGEQAEAALRKVLTTGEPLLNVELTGTTPSRPGVVRTFSERWVPWKDSSGKIVGISVAAEETTERKRLEAALRESEARFRAMADAAPVMIWVTNPQGELEMVNRAYEEFFGLTEAQLKAPGTWQRLVHPDDAEGYMAVAWAAVREQKPADAEVRVRHRSGQWRWVHSYATPRFGAAGEYLGHVGSSPEIMKGKVRAAEEAGEGASYAGVLSLHPHQNH